MKLISIAFILFTAGVVAQPVVPDRVQFADIKLKISESARREIQEDVDAFTRSSTYFEAKVERARMYFPIIERILKEEGISDDVKYLVIQESALISDAVSVSNAVGYWQFKEATAIEMGLRVDKYVDERMNIVASTHAAAKYIRKNNFYFNNWLYALQAYQMGAGGVQKAENSKYFGAKSMTISKKTYWYVKKYLAHRFAYEYALNQERNPQKELVEFTRGAGMDIHDISKELMVDKEELQKYNKWLKKGEIPKDKIYTVIVPYQFGVGKEIIASNFLESETMVEPKVSSEPAFKGREDPGSFPVISDGKGTFNKNPEYVKINNIPGIVGQSKMQIGVVAIEAGISESEFRKFNEIMPHQQIEEGQVYYFKQKKGKAKVHYHTLVPGESLWMVSQKYGVKLSKLVKKNRLNSDKDVKEGMVIWLRYIRPADEPVKYKEVDKLAVVTPEKRFVSDNNGSGGVVEMESAIRNVNEQVSNTPNTRIIHHQIQQKETLYSIAKRYDVSISDIAEKNELELSVPLKVMDILRIEVPANYVTTDTISNDLSSPSNIENKIQQETYIVKAGDTLYSIAIRFNTTVDKLQDLNNLKESNLSIGDKLLIRDQ